MSNRCGRLVPHLTPPLVIGTGRYGIARYEQRPPGMVVAKTCLATGLSQTILSQLTLASEEIADTQGCGSIKQLVPKCASSAFQRVLHARHER